MEAGGKVKLYHQIFQSLFSGERERQAYNG